MYMDIWFGRCTNILGSVVLFGLISGCGNGGSSTPPPPPPPPMPVQGIYYGQYTVTGAASPINVYGAIESGGFAYFTDEYGALYVLPTITDTGAVNGIMTAYAPPGQTFSNGESVTTFQVNATASTSGVFITGGFSQPGESGSFQLNYEPLTIGNVTAAAGAYQGFYWATAEIRPSA